MPPRPRAVSSRAYRMAYPAAAAAAAATARARAVRRALALRRLDALYARRNARYYARVSAAKRQLRYNVRRMPMDIRRKIRSYM